ncbi:MAG: OmpA family protein [Bacteroidota bacterium]
MINRHLLLIAVLSATTIVAQDSKIKRANERFDEFAYMRAILSYEELVDNGYDDKQIFQRLGNANYWNARYEEASQWYGRAMQLENTDVDSELYYRYAQSLKSSGEYDQSNKWMQQLSSASTNDQRAKNFEDNINYLDRIQENSGRYDLELLSINSPQSDFAPSLRGNELIFSTARDTGSTTKYIHKWNNGSFLNLHSSNISKDGDLTAPEKFSNAINTKTHESSSTFTKDGKTIYFTRNNSKNRGFARDSMGISRLKIYKAVFKDEKWQEPIALPFNSDDYSSAHPALSSDGKTLYFCSNMPGSLGDSDIFKVSINEDGSFGTPENLGAAINTESRETFPFILEDVLYFSSDGHPGLGGLDVFAVQLGNPKTKVINLGKPLNSQQDDFSFILKDNGKGYFASNRSGGLGGDDIYAFVETKPLVFECNAAVTGIAIAKESGSPLSDAKVIFKDGETVVGETRSDEKGRFEMVLDCAEAVTVSADKEGYLTINRTFENADNTAKELVLELVKEAPPAPMVGADLLEFLNSDLVYFNLNKANLSADAQDILLKAVVYLQANPNVKIQVQAHTDAKGSDRYNQKLSERRAKATVNFLIANGIDAKRLDGKGFGKTQLANTCAVWEECDQKENGKNRRANLVVVGE